MQVTVVYKLGNCNKKGEIGEQELRSLISSEPLGFLKLV